MTEEKLNGDGSMSVLSCQLPSQCDPICKLSCICWGDPSTVSSRLFHYKQDWLGEIGSVVYLWLYYTTTVDNY